MGSHSEKVQTKAITKGRKVKIEVDDPRRDEAAPSKRICFGVLSVPSWEKKYVWASFPFGGFVWAGMGHTLAGSKVGQRSP